MTLLISPAPFASTDPGLEFGNTTTYPYSPSRPHQGKDWKWRVSDVTRSRRVVAPAGGKVTRIYSSGGNNRGWGNRVEITVPATGVKIVAALNHLLTGSIAVKVGQTVEAGDYIGQMGATGETGGQVHLHEELWINGVRVDPDIYRKKHLPGTPASAGSNEEDDMPLNDADKKFIADAVAAGVKAEAGDAVWGSKNNASKRSFGGMLNGVWESVRIGKTGSWHHGKMYAVLLAVQRRVGALELGAAPTGEQLDELADELKASLPAAVAKELAKRLAS
ncbi:M23 family metallopeptidase [Microbacterium dauci]|uniref:M23 family metallopeptidase n=1 Tax=Microbacterium dauci TaxID=3048008 RepID=A0ABT6ZAQ0_9MICO|nr:M23 family metallopeptidase [Microbacterium sp. LX3-4]MDJ1113246.1 M23 family metallopeptidase [Microbacterium sp. LX3-4]